MVDESREDSLDTTAEGRRVMVREGAFAAMSARKFEVDAPSSSTIRRERLTTRLAGSSEAAVLLVSASAGSGKSALLAQWVAGMDRRAWGWVSHEPADDDPARFWACILEAVTRAGHRVDPEVARVVRRHPTDAAVAAAAVGSALAVADGLRALVLDDFHQITNTDVVTGLSLLTSLLPDGFRIALGTRVDPPLPVHRWRLGGKLVEVRDSDLRFSRDEAADLLAHHGLDLGDDDLDRLLDQTEGWAAGLQLAALALRRCGDVDALLTRFTSSHQPLVDFLAGEVLDQQSPDRRRFLEAAACMGQFSPALLDAVLGRGDSDEELRAVRRENLFVVPLVQPSGWFRFHHLFGRVLAEQVAARDPGRAGDIHRRTGEWLRDHGELGKAIEHLCAAGEWQPALDLVHELVVPTFDRGHFATVRRWVAGFPTGFLDADAERSVVAGVAWSAGGDPVQAERWLRRALARAEPGSWAHDRALLILSAVKLYLGDPRAGLHLLDRVAAGRWRPYAVARAHAQAGHAHVMLGQLPAARTSVGRALAAPHADAITVDVLAPAVLSLIAVREGRLREAAAHAERALAHPTVGGGGHLYAIAAETTLVELAVERGDLAEAEEQAMRLCSSAREVGGLSTLIDAHVLLARVAHARHDTDAALDHLAEGWRVARSVGMAPIVVAALDEMEARVRMDAGDLGLAQELVARLPASSGRLPEARLALAQRDTGRARAVLRATTGGVWTPLRWRIERELLLAVAAAAADDPDAEFHVDRALALAEPEGFHRTILDAGDPIPRLVVEAVERARSSYVAGLARAVDPGGRTAERSRAAPGVALTPAEERVLFYLASQLSMAELAAHLGVSRNTVKTHVRSVYRKLGVRSRDAAVERARSPGAGGT